MFSNFLDNFYGILFNPRETFDRLKESPSLMQGVLIIVAISALGAILKFELFSGIESLFFLGFSIFAAVIGGVISWFFFAAFLDILASIFKWPGRMKIFLTLSAFALVPWLFLAPLELLKNGGVIGAMFGIILGLLVWLWVVILIFTAVHKAYDLSFGRTLSILIIPFFGGIIAFHWFIGFFSTLIQIIKV